MDVIKNIGIVIGTLSGAIGLATLIIRAMNSYMEKRMARHFERIEAQQKEMLDAVQEILKKQAQQESELKGIKNQISGMRVTAENYYKSNLYDDYYRMLNRKCATAQEKYRFYDDLDAYMQGGYNSISKDMRSEIQKLTVISEDELKEIKHNEIRKLFELA